MPSKRDFTERKLRRRIEEFLRTTTTEMLIKIADLCRIKVPDKLREKHTTRDDREK